MDTLYKRGTHFTLKQFTVFPLLLVNQSKREGVNAVIPLVLTSVEA